MMSVTDKITAIDNWQTDPSHDPIKCKMDPNHSRMRPAVANGLVILMCTDCESKQSVPDEVYEPYKKFKDEIEETLNRR